MWVVFSFHNNKQSASKNLTVIKKKFPEAKINQTKDGLFAVVISETFDKKKANAIIHEAVMQGYWGGIYEEDSN